MNATQILILYKVYARTGIIPTWDIIWRADDGVRLAHSEIMSILYLSMYSEFEGYEVEHILDIVDPYKYRRSNGTRNSSDIFTLTRERRV